MDEDDVDETVAVVRLSACLGVSDWRFLKTHCESLTISLIIAEVWEAGEARTGAPAGRSPLQRGQGTRLCDGARGGRINARGHAMDCFLRKIF